MTMKTIISGSRGIRNYEVVITAVREVLKANPNLKITEVVSGGAVGVDFYGEQLARFCGIPIKRFPANWEKHHRSAGPIRNNQMAEYADQLIAIWDGKSKGTQHMIEAMRLKSKPVHIYRDAP